MNITHDDMEITREGIITRLSKSNSYEYNLHKASEELQELSLVLTQKLTKPAKVFDQEIIDEIGDVQIRLDILKKIFDSDKIDKRIAYKLKKFQEFADSGKYKQI
jgi:hypothetical protein